MRFRKLRIAWSVGCALAAMSLVGCGSPAVTPVAGGTQAGDSHEKPSSVGPTISVPLYAIVSTSRQRELERASETSPTIGGKPVFALLSESDLRAPAVFLVEAPTLTTAILGTYQVRRADKPVTLNIPEPPTGNYWLAVFLGRSGSGPPNWLVDSVTIQERQIRFSYHWQGAKTKDLLYYYYWAPIGKLDGGTYNVELYETKLNQVTLKQRVEVMESSPR